MKKEINEYLNLKHLIEGRKQIEKIEQDLLNFNKEFFQNQILSRDGVLDYLTEEDLKIYKVFGLSVKEFLDLAESEKHETGFGQYIIDRKNKTIHVYRYPSLPEFVTIILDYGIDYEENVLLVYQTFNFESAFHCYKNPNRFYNPNHYTNPKNIHVCEARLLEGKHREKIINIGKAQYYRQNGLHYTPYPAIIQNINQSITYVFDISNNTLKEIRTPINKRGW